LRFFLAGLTVLMLLPGVARAEDPREPGVVTLRSGGLSVELQRAHSWSIQRITFRGVPVAEPTGAFGAVVCVPVSGGWVGSAHTAGGIERVRQVGLTVDGHLAELEPGATYTGERLVLQKTSMLDKLRLQATLTLAGGVLTQRHELTATEDVVVTELYPFTYPITTAATRWMAMTEACEETAGEFGGEDEIEWHDDRDWTAAYIPERSTGVVVRHLLRPEHARTQTAWWEQDRYHKLYVRWVGETEPWPEGLTLAGEVALRCFEAPSADWQSAAREAAAGLMPR
jgi:hypothetical protein